MSNLGEYIKSKTGQAFRWGKNDCCTFCADWLVMNNHPDPMADLRGEYSSETDAEFIIAEHGDLLTLWTRILGEPDDTLSDGSVAIVNFNSEQLGGIVSGDRLILLLNKGICAIRLEALVILGSWRG